MAFATERMIAGMGAEAAKNLGGQYNTIAAAGNAIGNATVVTASLCVVTGATGGTGVILKGEVGDEVTLYNNAGNTLLVYPESGGKITISGTGLGTTSAAVSLATYKSGRYVKVTTTQWVSILSA